MGNSNGKRSGTVGSFGNLKLDIPDRTVPHHLERVSPDHSIFQTILLALCKRRNRSIPSPKATVLNPSPAFKTGPPPRFSERALLPLPILGFSLLSERLGSPSRRSYFSFMALRDEWKTLQN
ncbi:hypothetical protein AVEN_23464-1 [Araneus ventricosus]|uniref:Uncharacterized protein n=1 Tax=Araneus ventricosus TaxID=182803 RepID=A0A4Y2E710_ARAVE|nr:hypothetical protein AVEN_23464-1 [Araneus ventricosus]